MIRAVGRLIFFNRMIILIAVLTHISFLLYKRCRGLSNDAVEQWCADSDLTVVVTARRCCCRVVTLKMHRIITGLTKSLLCGTAITLC